MATDAQKWKIVNSSKNLYDIPELKELRLRWQDLSFYNLPEMTKAEASAIISQFQSWNSDMEILKEFFQKWISAKDAQSQKIT